MLAFGQIPQVDSVIAKPLIPGLRCCNLCLDLVVFYDSSSDGVHQEHLPWLKSSLANNLGGFDVSNTNLGS